MSSLALVRRLCCDPAKISEIIQDNSVIWNNSVFSLNDQTTWMRDINTSMPRPFIGTATSTGFREGNVGLQFPILVSVALQLKNSEYNRLQAYESRTTENIATWNGTWQQEHSIVEGTFHRALARKNPNVDTKFETLLVGFEQL